MWNNHIEVDTTLRFANRVSGFRCESSQNIRAQSSHQFCAECGKSCCHHCHEVIAGEIVCTECYENAE